MKNFIVLVCALALYGITLSSASSSQCYDSTNDFCDKQLQNNRDSLVHKCNASYSGVSHAVPGLQDYVFQHIIHSYRYLQMSTVFASYKRNRGGFEKFFKHLSDDTWDDTIDLIKYITKRGYKMDFSTMERNCVNSPVAVNYCTSDLNTLTDLDEVQSFSKALDLHKKLAYGAHYIHGEVTKRRNGIHDPEVLSFLEEEFVHKHANMIRTLSGHLNDLIDMIHDTSDTEGNLAVYLFDEYLSKSV